MTENESTSDHAGDLIRPHGGHEVPGLGEVSDLTNEPYSTGLIKIVRRMIRSYLVVALIPIAFFVFTEMNPAAFLTLSTVQGILTTNAPLLIMAVGLTIAMSTGEWDLSFFGLMGCSAGMFTAVLTRFHAGQPAAFGLTLAFAIAVGLTNAFVIVRLNVASFIATLGMGLLTEGIGLAFTNSETVPDTSRSLTAITTTSFGGIGLPFFYGIIFAALAFYVLEYTPTGRHMYFTGEGRVAARLAGVKVDKLRAGGLIISALAAWAGGLVLAGQTGSADATFGVPYITLVLASVFLGFACIRVGRFNVLGTLVGVFVLGVSSIGLDVVTSASWAPDVFTGALLVAAVVFANVLGKDSYETQ